MGSSVNTPPPRTLDDDPETPPSVLTRFGITTLEQDLETGIVVTAMPAGRMRNPLTGLPSVAGLAILVDDAAGRANFFRRGQGWTVSSELTVDLTAGAAESLLRFPDEPVIAHAHPVGDPEPPMLAVCSLSHHGNAIGSGSVHTMPLGGGAPDGSPSRGTDPLAANPDCALAELMAVEPMPTEDGRHRLRQNADPLINNLAGIVHGGVSTAGLELVASAAINHGQDDPLRTTSIRVNFLRPFFAGAESVYEGTQLRIGRSTAVGDARAIGADGKAAIVARITAYR